MSIYMPEDQPCMATLSTSALSSGHRSMGVDVSSALSKSILRVSSMAASLSTHPNDHKIAPVRRMAIIQSPNGFSLFLLTAEKKYVRATLHPTG